MSKPDYEKELIDSLWLAARLGVYTTLFALGGKKLLAVTAPSTKMDLSDGIKLGGYLTAAILIDDYAIKQAWYKDKMSK
jgi:hypothetical protein